MICKISKEKYNVKEELEKCNNESEENAVLHGFKLKYYRSINSTFDKNSFKNKIYYFECPDCGNKILTTNSRFVCNICHYSNSKGTSKFLCKITGKELKFYDELKKCKNIGEINAINHDISIEAYRNTKSIFEKENFNKQIYITKCRNCKYILMSSSSSKNCCCYDCKNDLFKCKLTKKEFSFKKEKLKCKNIGEINALNNKISIEAYRNTNAKFNKDQYENKIIISICPKCGYIELKNNTRIICEKCGYGSYISDNPFFICRICNEKHYYNIELEKCKNKDEKIIINRKICLNCYKNTNKSIDFDINKNIYVNICQNCKNIRLSNKAIWTCDKCNFVNIKQHHICPDCGFKEINSCPKSAWKCPKCGWYPDYCMNYVNKKTFETRQYYHICPDCGFEGYNACPDNMWQCECGYTLSNTILGFKGIKREDFYNSELNLIKLDNSSDFLKIETILNKKEFPGVWAFWNLNDNVCLQVGQNEKVKKELRRQIRLMRKYSANNWPNDHSNAEYFHNIGVLKNQKNLAIKIIAKDIKDLDQRLIIEAQYAHDNKAKYWSPQPGQFKYLNKIKGEM